MLESAVIQQWTKSIRFARRSSTFANDVHDHDRWRLPRFNGSLTDFAVIAFSDIKHIAAINDRLVDVHGRGRRRFRSGYPHRNPCQRRVADLPVEAEAR